MNMKRVAVLGTVGAVGSAAAPCANDGECADGLHCYRPASANSACILGTHLGGGDPMKWAYSPGVTFSLAELHSDKGYRLLDDNSFNGTYEYAYYFNIGSDLDRKKWTDPDMEKYCANTSQYAGSGGTGPEITAPAYQLWEDLSRCEKIGGPVSSETYKLHLVDAIDQPHLPKDELDPTKGFAVYYQGGDHCESLGHNNRTLTILVRCEADDTPVPVDEPVMESETCHYQMDIPSIHGCPTECHTFGNKICAGHGTCGYNWETKTAGCFCEEGHFGVDCTAHCTEDCGAHGHCEYDNDKSVAACFCNAGWAGDTCSDVAKTGSSLGWIFFVLAMVGLVGMCVYHRRSHRLPMMPTGGHKTYDNFIDEDVDGYSPPTTNV